jgi:DNA-directed RNA polymerase beta' subunit
MEKRYLTPKEIKYILDFIKPKPGIPKETADSLVKIHKDKLTKQLKSEQLYKKNIKEDIEEIKQNIMKYYYSSMIQAGEAVGVITAQSIGEKNTQNTLNTFHKAGMTEKTVVAGVPRFEELLNTTHNPKGVCCSVYFNRGTETIQSLRKVIGYSIVELNFEKIATSIVVNMNKVDELWYPTYKVLHNDEFAKYDHCITIKLNMAMLYEYSLTMQEIIDIVESEYGDFHCVCSPSSFGQIDIFVDTSEIDIDDDIQYITQDNKEEIHLDEVVKPELKKLHLCGIEGIESVFYINKEGEWMVETDGSNFQELIIHPFVDETRTVSNDIWDMYDVLGIQATRKALHREFKDIMGSINSCHIDLLVDKMTYTGAISSISRYAMKKEEAGPMSKASFEQSLENFINAAAFGERESTRGVSASIMCGKRPRIGTGVCSLHIDVMKLLEMTESSNLVTAI